MSYRLAAGLVILAGAAGLAIVVIVAPEYLFRLGFPLDDAWIHAVYARSFARSGTFAYNPGIPATGATSPLWTVVLAVPHLVASDPRTFLLYAKLLGFAVHVAAALLLLRALGDGIKAQPAQVAGAVVVALHPDLVSASMSGMEVPLASLAAAGLLLAAGSASPLVYGIACFLAPLARPELTVLCFAIPCLMLARRSHQRLRALLVAACVGNVLSYAIVGLRNLAVSGLPLPAAFYAKFAVSHLSILDAQTIGWGEIVSRFPITDSAILVVAAALVAVLTVVSRDPASLATQHAAVAFLAGAVFCVASFIAIPPLDPKAFYHQRYVLPALPLIVGAMPTLLCELPRRLLAVRPARVVQFAIVVVCVMSVIVCANGRYAALVSDARNIDDVQVAIGKHLASASPDQTVWAVDAGAVRYFGRPFVVDLVGLNSIQMLGPNAATFLADHRPGYIETVGEWSQLEVESPQRMQTISFKASTDYTVTTYEAMQQHWIVVCDDPTIAGQVVMRQRRLPFRCAPPAGIRSTAAR